MTKTLVMMLPILFMPLPSFAECAWVLWSEKTINSSTPPYERVSWTVEKSAVESAVVCRAMKDAGVQSIARQARVAQQTPGMNVESVEVAGDELVVTVLKTGGDVRDRFVCLPDTVDPRPR